MMSLRAGRLAIILAASAAVLGLLAGCAAQAPRSSAPFAAHLHRSDALGDCARSMAEIDEAIDSRGVRDSGETRIAGYPYLRVNRLLTRLRERVAPRSPAFERWVDALMDLDRSAREAELANLGRGGIDAWTRCAVELRRADLSSPGAPETLLERAVTPASYRPSLRVLGLYPLSAIAFSIGISRLHERTRRVFARPLAELPVHGRLVRYLPRVRGGSKRDPGEVLRHAAVDELGIPTVSASQLLALFERYAPVWEIDQLSADDRPGPLVWGVHRVEAGRTEPVVYYRLSYVIFGARVLVQLSYVIWFPARTESGPMDLLAGHLDGITWRVTLDRDGQPLLYDSMHNCGCYHMFLPTGRLVRHEPQSAAWDEPIVVPQVVPPIAGRAVLRVAARTHYLQRVYAQDGARVASESYRLRPYAELRSLPLPGRPGGQRSAFAPDALVAGSERPERWLFWPMGVPSAGAMRQWGHHAIAFVGRRHFDDPDLLQRYFRRADPP